MTSPEPDSPVVAHPESLDSIPTSTPVTEAMDQLASIWQRDNASTLDRLEAIRVVLVALAHQATGATSSEV